jgi:hypothetical protein
VKKRLKNLDEVLGSENPKIGIVKCLYSYLQIITVLHCMLYSVAFLILFSLNVEVYLTPPPNRNNKIISYITELINPLRN